MAYFSRSPKKWKGLSFSGVEYSKDPVFSFVSSFTSVLIRQFYMRKRAIKQDGAIRALFLISQEKVFSSEEPSAVEGDDLSV
jgi:hypothetical protein